MPSPTIDQLERHAIKVDALKSAVLHSAGHTDPAVREAAYRGGNIPQALKAYVMKVIGQSYKVTDPDIERLLSAGYSQDAVFEITVAAALGAACERLDAGLRALRQGG